VTDKFDFTAYVRDEKRKGRSESQIARSLGMSLAHFMGRLNGVDVDKVDPPKEPKEQHKKTKVKPVSGADSYKKEEKTLPTVENATIEE